MKRQADTMEVHEEALLFSVCPDSWIWAFGLGPSKYILSSSCFPKVSSNTSLS